MQGERFEPSTEQRRTVRAMAGFGMPQEEIATFLEIDAKTLRKHFRAELDRGSTEATAKVAQSLFRMATEGNNVAAAIFWMKARAGWSEKQRIEHSAPLAVISGVPRHDDLSRMTDDELRAELQLLEKALDRQPPMTEDQWTQRYAPQHRET